LDVVNKTGDAMRKFKATLWGSFSALVGLLSILPSFPLFPRHKLALAQIVATENPGLALVAGGMALWKGLWSGAWRAMLLGAVGFALGMRPLIRRKEVNRAMSDAMRAGLGSGWQKQIPPDVHRAFGQSHRTDTWGPLRYLLRIRVRETCDVLFAVPDGHPLRLDVYESQNGNGNRSAIVVVHGGAWFQGDKSTHAFGLHDRWLAAQGYVVFDVQYRLSGQWPAPLTDVKCAIRWVRANAARYGVDPDRIAIMGRAAGAHLALLAAYTANDPRFGASCFEDVDESVQAVIVSYPPVDLRLWPAERGSAIEQLMGGLPDE
jgi:acetyl esterase/lipase